ncbi:hypothetical protein D918_02467 [Trichuris suis]|nr:hypothetical protein D918_02467 [Trichuris suis]
MLGLRCERDSGESTSAKSWSTKAEATNDLTICWPGAKLSKADGGAQTLPTAVARLHALISEAQEKKLQPFDGCPVALRDDLSFALHQVVENSDSAAACDLLEFFEQPHMKALLFAFDCLTRRDFDSSLPDVPHEVDEDEGLAVRIVRLVKNGQPLGATIKAEQNGALIIARIMRGGVADRSGCLNSGDQVVEVNGVNVVGKKPTDVVKLLNSSSGSVTFKLIPAPAQLPTNGFSCSDTSGCGTPVFLRAMFDYNPNDDFYNPCPEASLAFGNLYGTCVDSVKELMDQGRVCVLNPHPQAIRLLRTGELKPYFVYVRPPPFPTLKATRTSQAERGNGALMSNEDFEQMIEQGKALETVFGCFFDYVLVNSSLEVAVRELLDIASSLELDSHWVPSAWL